MIGRLVATLSFSLTMAAIAAAPYVHTIATLKGVTP